MAEVNLQEPLVGAERKGRDRFHAADIVMAGRIEERPDAAPRACGRQFFADSLIPSRVRYEDLLPLATFRDPPDVMDDRPKCREDGVAVRPLADIGGRPCLDDGCSEQIRKQTTEYQDPGLGLLPRNRCEHVEAADVRQLEIYHDEAWSHQRDAPQRARTRLCLTHDAKVGLCVDQAPEPLSHDLVVVCDDNGGLIHSSQPLKPISGHALDRA